MPDAPNPTPLETTSHDESPDALAELLIAGLRAGIYAIRVDPARRAVLLHLSDDAESTD